VKVRFWGVRGSIASPGPRTAKYGGNTPCVELRVAGQTIIVDAGTGIRELGNSLLKEAAGKPLAGHLFIGHTHWDHIQGFPFFVPLYVPTSKFTVYGMRGTTKPFLDVMSGQMNPSYFPVQLKDMGSKPEFVELNAPVMVGEVKVSYHYLNHPGITVGYRFEHGGKAFTYISDHEPYGKLNASGDFADKEDAAVARFVAGSDLLVVEAQYTADEYKLKRGWGHSTFGDVLDLAQKASVKRLALFHHDPSHDDEQMAGYEAECVRLVSSRGLSTELFAAREGQEIQL
jgi:phosphoribosyl 1,2-cyclic phosphodiesterase